MTPFFLIVLAASGLFDPQLDQALASRLVKLSLDCTARPWPNKPSHVYEGAKQLRPPQELTPAFYGCYDWHSAVHGHWAMLRLLRRFPALPQAKAVRARLKDHLSAKKLKAEAAFFAEKRNATFERPYGWGWFLRLAAEMETAAEEDPHLGPLVVNTRDLGLLFSVRLQHYLKRLSVPLRAGTHDNTAFALIHAWDYAVKVKDWDLQKAIREHALRFYEKDKNCPTAYEPSGEDFISPCLTEADLMGRLLPAEEFPGWLEGFLPAVDSAQFAPLARPTEVLDKEDPRIGHLIGLAMQRAWSYESIAQRLPQGDARKAAFLKLADDHQKAGLTQMFESGYGGEHWLASFAIFMLSAD